MTDAVRRGGPVGIVPSTGDDLLDTRTWLSWTALVGFVPGLGRSVSEVRGGESAVLWR